MTTVSGTLSELVACLQSLTADNQKSVFEEKIHPAVKTLRSFAEESPDAKLLSQLVRPLETWVEVAASDSPLASKYVERMIKYARQYIILAKAQEFGATKTTPKRSG